MYDSYHVWVFTAWMTSHHERIPLNSVGLIMGTHHIPG